MTQYLKTTLSAKKMLGHAALAAAFFAFTPWTMAQEEGGSTPPAEEAAAKQAPLIPNLTVNVKLNSALGEKETEFYSKIAQELISKLPHQLNLAGKDAAALKDLDEAYKHLNVVTYFPPTDDVQTDKLIKHFKVRFVFDDSEGAKTADEAQDIVLPKALQQEKQKEDDTKTVALREPDAAKEVPPVPLPPAKAEKTVEQNKTPNPVVPDVKPQPKPAVVAAAATPKPKAAPVAAGNKQVNRLRLTFETDETRLTNGQRQAIMKFIQDIRHTSKQPDGFVFVVRSYEGPIGVEDSLGEARLRGLTALLRQQDINVSRSRVTEIFVRTNSQQFVEVQPVY